MKNETRILYIGIASREQMRARTIAIAKGEHRPTEKEPKVWFTSIESLAQVLSSKNQLLLDMIRASRPASLRELAQLSDREESNLSRTLHTMEQYGLVRLNKEKGKLVPEVPYDEITFNLPMTSAAVSANKSGLFAHAN